MAASITGELTKLKLLEPDFTQAKAEQVRRCASCIHTILFSP